MSKGKVKQKYHRVRLDEVKLIHKNFIGVKYLHIGSKDGIYVLVDITLLITYLYNNCKLN